MLDTYKKEAGIYIFTNKTSGKKYVGETMNVKERMNYYNSFRCKRPIECALVKYGIDGFDIEVKYFPDFNKDDLLDLEESMIKSLNCLVPNGYNICVRGTSGVGKFVSEETKMKISASLTGRPKSYEHAMKVGLAHKGKTQREETKRKISITKQNPSDETRKKISNAGKGNTYRRLAIDQLTLEGEYIKTFPSITHAASEIGCSITSINNMLCDRAKTSNGFKWRYSLCKF
jgi:group I intron endonuclease